MNKLLTIAFNTIVMIFVCVFYAHKINWSLTRKYRIIVMIADMPDGLPALGAPNVLGGLVLLDQEWYDIYRRHNGRIVNFAILHEKGHCRSWAAIPGLTEIIRGRIDGSLGHSRDKTAECEYAADLYAAEHGAKKGGIELLKEYYAGGRDKDCVRRIRALKRWRKA